MSEGIDGERVTAEGGARIRFVCERRSAAIFAVTSDASTYSDCCSLCLFLSLR